MVCNPLVEAVHCPPEKPVVLVPAQQECPPAAAVGQRSKSGAHPPESLPIGFNEVGCFPEVGFRKPRDLAMDLLVRFVPDPAAGELPPPQYPIVAKTAVAIPYQ